MMKGSQVQFNSQSLDQIYFIKDTFERLNGRNGSQVPFSHIITVLIALVALKSLKGHVLINRSFGMSTFFLCNYFYLTRKIKFHFFIFMCILYTCTPLAINACFMKYNSSENLCYCSLPPSIMDTGTS